MSGAERILAVDIGGYSVKAAEFEVVEGERPVLHFLRAKSYDIGQSGRDRWEAMLMTMNRVLFDPAVTASKVCVSLPLNALMVSYSVFVDASKQAAIAKVIEQQASFSDDDWVGGVNQGMEGPPFELVIFGRARVVDSFRKTVARAGKELLFVDSSPVAAYNAAKAAGIVKDENAMLLNFGHRVSSLTFFGGKMDGPYTKMLSGGGYAISQQASNEFGISFGAAQLMKEQAAFVALGGAFAEPKSEFASTLSKITRNVATNIHAQINREINEARLRWDAEEPDVMYLTGGGSTMPLMSEFFAEKLRMPVKYFSPLAAVDTAISPEIMAGFGVVAAELVGLALRASGNAEIVVDLSPMSTERPPRESGSLMIGISESVRKETHELCPGDVSIGDVGITVSTNAGVSSANAMDDVELRVNGMVTDSAELKHGDVVQSGVAEYLFVCDGDARERPSSLVDGVNVCSLPPDESTWATIRKPID